MATCPLWLEFLDRIFALNADLIEFVRRVCGMCLTGDVSEQVLLVYHGVGANGKSVLLNTQAAMMGLDYAMQAPPDLLMEKRGDTHPTDARRPTRQAAGVLDRNRGRPATGGKPRQVTDRRRPSTRPSNARRISGNSCRHTS